MKKNHKNKFKTPEGYFENFNDRLMARLHEDTTDSVIPKNDGFGVPEGYFEDFTVKLSADIDGKETKVIALRSYRKYLFAAAFIAALFVLVFILDLGETDEVDFDTLANTEIDAYFDANDIELSSYELAELIEINTETLDPLGAWPIEDASLLDYLDENVDTYEELNLDYDEIDYE